ncbi:MAG: diguanylate cyclase [Xanthomonadaceae bacterium]|nr:diguanylate cyclase [Xanthomonadaceae bacterium]
MRTDSPPGSELPARALDALAVLAGYRGRPLDLLPQWLAELGEACGVDGLGLQRREGEDLVYVATTGSLGGQNGVRQRLDGSLGGVALRSHAPALSADALHDPRIDRGICLATGAGALLAIPVEVSGAPAAVLLAVWRQPHAIGETVQRVLRIGAALVGGGIARSVLAERGEDPERTVATAFAQRRHEEAQGRAQAELDPLTGLLRRAPFQTALTAAVAHWSPGQGSAVLFIDLDRFRRVNEAHGHATGDAVLQRMAELLRRCTRGHEWWPGSATMISPCC